jgi:hypothetical protein
MNMKILVMRVLIMGKVIRVLGMKVRIMMALIMAAIITEMELELKAVAIRVAKKTVSIASFRYYRDGAVSDKNISKVITVGGP